MATLVVRTQSILLNPSPSASPHLLPLSLPATPNTFPLILSPSSSSADDQLHHPHKPRSSSAPDNPKRIRFAPLPIPDPNSNAVFLESELSSQEPSPIPGSSQVSFIPESALLANPSKEDQCRTPTELTPPTFQSHASSLPPSPTWGKPSFSKRLLKPLFASWSKSSSIQPDDDSLFRYPSRESSQSSLCSRPKSNSKSVDELGSTLSRWTSSGSITSYVSDSGRSLNRRPKNSFSGSSLNPLSRMRPPPVTKHPSAKPGMRMLNGRVYGRKRPFSQTSTDPFANVKSQEPEFVEWGYGGMGSNKTNDHSGVGGKWKSVQGDGNTAFGGRNAIDDEDASGMAWVRRRREQRERERLKKEQEAKEKESEERQSEVRTGTPQLAPIKVEPTQIEVKEEEKTPKFKTDSLPPGPSALNPHDSQEHITAITLLPASHKHHHPHTLKRDLSAFKMQPAIIQTSTNGEEPPGIIDFEMDLAAIAAKDSDKKLEQIGRDRSDSIGSASEDDSVTDDEDEEDSDSYSDIEDEEATRRTAVGAGVEKISRHREHQNSISSGIAHNDLLPDATE